MATFQHLTQDVILGIHRAALDAKLAGEQTVLLAGLPAGYVASLPSRGPDSARLLETLHLLNTVSELADGSVPLVVWLKNAVALSATLPEARVFDGALTALCSSPAQLPLLATRRQHAAVATSPGANGKVDVVVLTALTLEYQAALGVDTGAWLGSAWQSEISRQGLPVAFRVFCAADGTPLRVALAQAGDMGMVPASNALAPLMERHAPTCIAMCGVCAGRPGKTSLGDVIAAERLFLHDAGKQLAAAVQHDLRTYNLRDDWKVALEQFAFGREFQNAAWLQERPVPYDWQENWLLAKLMEGVSDPSVLPDARRCCPQWTSVLDALWKSGDLEDGSMVLTGRGRARIHRTLLRHHSMFPDLSPQGAVLPFRVHVGPMGTGNKVIEDAAIWDALSDPMRKTLGLDMEAVALGVLAHASACGHDRVDALVMKGVMDFANNGRDDHFKEFAARASMECLVAFLRHHFFRASP